MEIIVTGLTGAQIAAARAVWPDGDAGEDLRVTVADSGRMVLSGDPLTEDTATAAFRRALLSAPSEPLREVARLAIHAAMKDLAPSGFLVGPGGQPMMTVPAAESIVRTFSSRPSLGDAGFIRTGGGAFVHQSSGTDRL